MLYILIEKSAKMYILGVYVIMPMKFEIYLNVKTLHMS